MHPSQQLITTFYTAFSQKDYKTMAACYHPDATFHDGAFDLRGREIGLMWQMLCTRGKDLRLEFSNVQADDNTGSAHWDAWYTFSLTGNKVHNSIDARFVFRDGKILEHVDTFSFYRWSRQALGLIGWILGWTGILQKKTRIGARKNLDQFIASLPKEA